ncbi:hypothetical protein NSS79_19420 [Paenibacillus sp. FSL L8-0436]|uniref:hypothetical protein n=1 Tax=Paenibacillus sp. FSL L8-0436 TaxID=2954686 RepID=UPI0031580BB5
MSVNPVCTNTITVSVLTDPRKKAAGTHTVPGGSKRHRRAYPQSCVLLTLQLLFPEDTYPQQLLPIAQLQYKLSYNIVSFRTNML